MLTTAGIWGYRSCGIYIYWLNGPYKWQSQFHSIWSFNANLARSYMKKAFSSDYQEVINFFGNFQLTAALPDETTFKEK